ncbi:MAG: LON peptidase substrate-binding domain-containing protein [Gammaproteobacteria bacterium]
MEKNLSRELSLFPLNVNVLPGGYLPLQIFEPRYLDMVKDCMSKEIGFCVVLIKPSNRSKSESIDFYKKGTYAEIVDFNQLENGLLGITVQGKYRIEVLEESVQKDGLRLGRVYELDEEEESVNLEPSYKNIWNVLEDLSAHPEIKKLELDINFNDSSNVAYNLASLLPLTPPEKQTILEASTNVEKLDYLDQVLKKLGG